MRLVFVHHQTQEDGQEDGRDQVHHLDLGEAQHVQRQCHDEQRSHAGHLRDHRVPQIGLEEGGRQGNGTLVEQNGHGGEGHAQPQGGAEYNGTDAVQQGLGKEGGMVAGEAILEGAHDGHGPHAEEKAGGDEPLGDGGLSAVGHQPLRALLHPEPQGLHPPVQIQELADERPNDHGQNGDERVIAFQTAADAQIHDAQGHALLDDGLEPLSQGRAANGQQGGEPVGQPREQHAHQGAGQDGGGIEDGTCVQYVSRSF